MEAQTPAADSATSAPANNFMPDEEVDKVVEEAMRKAREELAAKKKAQDAKEAARKKAAADAAKAKAAEEARKKAAAKKAEEERVAKELMAKEPDIVKKTTEPSKSDTSSKSTQAAKATDEGAPVNLDDKPAAETKSVAKKEEKPSESSAKENKKSSDDTVKKSSSEKTETASSSRTESTPKKETAKAEEKPASSKESDSRDEQPTVKTTVKTNDNRPGRSQLTVKATAPAGGVTVPESANPYTPPASSSNTGTITISGRVLGIMSGPVPRILVRDSDYEFPVQVILPPTGGVMPIPGDEITGKGRSVGRGNQTVVEATTFKVVGKSVTMPANEPPPGPYGNPEPSAMPPGFMAPPVAPMVPPPFQPMPMVPPPVPF